MCHIDTLGRFVRLGKLPNPGLIRSDRKGKIPDGDPDEIWGEVSGFPFR